MTRQSKHAAGRLLRFPGSILGRTSLFVTGQQVPESGIYRVTHSAHRLPHEVTLLRGEQFPRCSRCGDSVTFELVQTAPQMTTGIVVYELPEVADKAKQSA